MYLMAMYMPFLQKSLLRSIAMFELILWFVAIVLFCYVFLYVAYLFEELVLYFQLSFVFLLPVSFIHSLFCVWFVLAFLLPRGEERRGNTLTPGLILR